VTVVRILLTVLPVAAGLVLAVVGLLGVRERLPRNRFFGVRTKATLRDDTAFLIGNKVAGLPVAVGGTVGVLGGGIAVLMPNTGGAIVTAATATVGMLAIASAGGALGHRAAASAPPPKPAPPAGCGGCACGNCGLVTGATAS
jgi:hypothetical protein